MNGFSHGRRPLLASLALLLLLAACGPSIDSLRGARDVQGLVAILADPAEKIVTRTRAAQALGVVGGPEVVEPLIAYMRECRDSVERTDAASNKQWGDTVEAIPPVTLLLGAVGDPRAVGPLIEMLDNNWGHDEAVQALGALNDPRALVPLIESLDHGMTQFTELQDRVAAHRPVVLALATDATPDTFDALNQALPGWDVEEGDCSKYLLGMDALVATQDPRVENVLLARMRAPAGFCQADPAGRLAELYQYDPAELLPLLKADVSGGIAALYYSLTPAPPPMEVDFASIVDYPVHTRVRITGRVSVSSILVCDPDCLVRLANPANDQQRFALYLHPNRQMAYMPAAYDESDFEVFLEDGGGVGNQALVRVTGTICEKYTTIEICDVTRIEAAE